MKWLAMVLVLLGIAGNTPAGSLLPCPQSATACPMACCENSQVDCCAANSGESQERPLQIPTNAKDLQILVSPVPARTVLLLPVAGDRVPARLAASAGVRVPADRLATLCSFLI